MRLAEPLHLDALHALAVEHVDPAGAVERLVGRGHRTVHRRQVQDELHGSAELQPGAALRHPEQAVGAARAAVDPRSQPMQDGAHLLPVDHRPRMEGLAAIQRRLHHRQVAKRDLGAELQHLRVEHREQPVPGAHPVARRDEHLGDPTPERRIDPRALEVEYRLGLLRPGPGELRLDLLPAAAVLADRELALLDREHLAFLVAALLIEARLRAHLALGEVPRSRHFAPGEIQQLLLVSQSGEVVSVPQRLVLQVGHQPVQLRVALRDHEPDLPIVEGEQPIVGAHPLAFEHVDGAHVGRHRRGQVRDARRIDEGEEHELGRHRSRLDRRDRYRPGPLLGPQRLALGLALDQRRHPADAGGEDQHRQGDSSDSVDSGQHGLERGVAGSGVLDRVRA